VAFTRDGGENGIYTIHIDGSDERRIFSGRATLASPKWSPDGNWIVFSRRDQFTECYQIGRQCLTLEQLREHFPKASPDQFPLVKDYKFKLSVVDPNGQNFHDVAALDSARTPDWTDAGIVYQSAAGIQATNDALDAKNRLVTFDYLNPYYFDPDWQPHGGQIAFMMRGASHWEIYVVNPDGSGMTALTRPKTALVDQLPSNVAPAWSPDGKHIVFLSNRQSDGNAGDWHIWVMDADGSNQRQLPINVPMQYSFGDEQIVSWGP
jgi:TolB protein